MIGINDLLRGMTDETMENQRQIVRYLRQVHPDSQIVVQSILPYSGEGFKLGRALGRITSLLTIISSPAEPAVAKRSHKQKALPISIYIPSSPTPKEISALT